ncbi:alpha/beta hydrolase [Paenibacillus chibensis]|uniref:alpha/beta hydrolase n=1 Tax=Paenibacillus chibensis TaxID=59846 RepID=UPI000FD812D9|nr:alpha/beta fold hydrolase [Paenibacillus chibensis]MEC0372421.1 alpha/beta fold hydrolase [Paenibacillus chibensis]
MSYNNQNTWKVIMNKLPHPYRFTDSYQPAEEWWTWNQDRIHLDTFRNPEASAKIILLHGVGTNGRQISLIAGGPLFKRGFETIMIDMPTYGMTEVTDRNNVTYADWVQIASDFIDAEAAQDDRPIFLYGLSAGGMETYHIACINRKVKGIIGMTFLDQRLQIVRDETTNNMFMSRVGVPATTISKKMGLGRLTLPMKLTSKMNALCNDQELMKVFLKDKTSAGNKASMNFLDSYMNYKPAIEAEDFNVCPVLLTQPEQDRWTPLHLSTPFLEQIKKVPVEIVILPNGGHYPVEPEALNVMNESIMNFINKAQTST